jgi:hypothetical protein
MRIHENGFAYDLEQPRDPQTQLPLKWRYTVYKVRPMEEVLCSGEAETREEAERKARAEIAKIVKRGSSAA